MKYWLSILTILTGLFLLTISGGQADDAPQAPEKQPIYFMTMHGAISPAFSGYLDAGLEKAREHSAQALVIELNTPGGLLSSTRDMATSIVESKTPVIVWVTPSGAHAASAGTFILYAAHIAAMDQGTNVGAATPIEMKGSLRGQLGEAIKEKDARDKKTIKQKESEDEFKKYFQGMMDPNAQALHQKALEDTTAFIRGLAELRGRNAEWGEKAVTDAESITAKEALEKNVIDLIATSRDDLLKQIDKKTVMLKSGDAVTLDTQGAPIVEFKPDWKIKLLTMITDPNVALILMSIGVYGLILEFYNPGTMISGTVGAISLVLGLYAMNVLPINAAGVVLILLGIAFIVAEAFIPSFGVMGISGLVAFIVGAMIMFDTESMPGLALDGSVIAGVVAVGLMVVGLIVFLTVKVYRQKVSTGTESMIGDTGHVVEWKKNKGRVRVQGEVWTATSEDTLDLKKDDAVLISAVDGLNLKVRATE